MITTKMIKLSSQLKLNLCDYYDAYIAVKRTSRLNGARQIEYK